MDHEHFLPADVLFNLHKRLAIGKGGDGAFAKLDSDVFTNGGGERRIGGAGEYFHAEIGWLVWTKVKKPVVAGWNCNRTVTMSRGRASAIFPAPSPALKLVPEEGIEPPTKGL